MTNDSKNIGPYPGQKTKCEISGDAVPGWAGNYLGRHPDLLAGQNPLVFGKLYGHVLADQRASQPALGSRGLALLAGVVGVLAGIGMLGRGLASNLIAEDVVISIVGLVIMLTGLLHMFGGFKQDQPESRRWSLTAFLLGIFEIILGVVLVISPLERGPVIYLAASVWALLGGLILIGDALRVRRMSQLE